MKLQFMKIYLAVLLVLYPVLPFAQQKALIDNNRINWRIITIPASFPDSNTIQISQTLIEVDIPTSVRNELLKYTYEDWVILLSGTSTDFAANLSLYDLSKRDASFFDPGIKRDTWRKCCKETDIKFWKKNLRHKGKPAP